jgi:hypothetical protein
VNFKTATVNDPHHELYGRVVAIVRETKWYTIVRPLYQNHVHFLTKEQFVVNEEPKGFLDMAKQVRLVVGEGDDKIEVGRADIERIPNGDAMVMLTISNPALIKALGGEKIKGIIPSFTEPEEDISE